jgi:hypothetical protein
MTTALWRIATPMGAGAIQPIRTAVIPLMKMLRPARMAAMRKLHCSIDL